MKSGTADVEIPVRPWFHDHAFAGRAVLPGVEIMLLLAAEAEKRMVGLETRCMGPALFSRFFDLPGNVSSCHALVAWEGVGERGLEIRLQTRVRLKLTSRIYEHARLVFPGRGPEPVPELDVVTGRAMNVAREIPAAQVYREYVPFGPAYQSLQKMLCLSTDGAVGRVKAPDLPLPPGADRIGSPFPLDGAMHAACVHGQGQVDFIPFPVGFARRIIYRPTRPGSRYLVRAKQTGTEGEELFYDLLIADDRGRVFEQVRGLRMRDVGVARGAQP